MAVRDAIWDPNRDLNSIPKFATRKTSLGESSLSFRLVVEDTKNHHEARTARRESSFVASFGAFRSAFALSSLLLSFPRRLFSFWFDRESNRVSESDDEEEERKRRKRFLSLFFPRFLSRPLLGDFFVGRTSLVSSSVYSRRTTRKRFARSSLSLLRCFVYSN